MNLRLFYSYWMDSAREMKSMIRIKHLANGTHEKCLKIKFAFGNNISEPVTSGGHLAEKQHLSHNQCGNPTQKTLRTIFLNVSAYELQL